MFIFNIFLLKISLYIKILFTIVCFMPIVLPKDKEIYELPPKKRTTTQTLNILDGA